MSALKRVKDDTLYYLYSPLKPFESFTVEEETQKQDQVQDLLHDLSVQLHVFPRSISPSRPATSACIPLKDFISVEGKIQSPKILSTNPMKTFEQLSNKSTSRATSVTGIGVLSVVDISKSASISVLPKSQVCSFQSHWPKTCARQQEYKARK